MLLFYCADADELDSIRREGLPEGAPLWPTLEAARQHDWQRLLVIDAQAWAEADSASLDSVSFASSTESMHGPPVPPRFIENLHPYRPPEPVTAAGGYVVRRDASATDPELLMIYRRGVWDLPKGKQETTESVRACARREVCEEVGIEHARLHRALGVTRHGYSLGERHAVKTTHWFLMTTPDDEFTPQRIEDIEQVRWTPWSDARERLGYATLRRHIAHIEPLIFSAEFLR